MIRSIEEFYKEHNVNPPTMSAIVLKGTIRGEFPALELVLLPRSIKAFWLRHSAAVEYFFLHPGLSFAYV
jgi:hypothetical protein